MESKKFDPAKLAKLNDPKRLTIMSPDLLWDTLGLSDPKVIVDIGAGTGFFAVAFSKKMRQGTVYACDISDVMLDWMKENLPADLKDSVVPLKMEETNVPLPDGIADLVYMINLHHELDSPKDIIAECHRLLKKGGTLMIIDWKKEEMEEGPPLAIRVTEDDIRSVVHEDGFTNVASHSVLPYHHFVVGEKI